MSSNIWAEDRLGVGNETESIGQWLGMEGELGIGMMIVNFIVWDVEKSMVAVLAIVETPFRNWVLLFNYQANLNENVEQAIS